MTAGPTLDRRLANYRSTLARTSGNADAPRRTPAPGVASEAARRLAEGLGGETVRGPAGVCVRVEWETIDVPVDRGRLASLPGHPPSDVPLVCLDTETTGLGTATGTYAFLIGLGWWQGSTFRTVQLLLPDHSDEAAVLAQVAAHIPRDGWLVTYNGRGFDWPLLVTRYRMNRSGPPAHAGHLDLLPLVRRLFRHRMPDARLRTAEEQLLGMRRHGDVDGWEIPGRYLDFLRGGPATLLADVARHNAEDVRSLGRVLRYVETRLADTDARRGAHPGDLVGLAGAFGRERRHAEALHCLDAALEAPPVPRAPRTWESMLTTRADEALFRRPAVPERTMGRRDREVPRRTRDPGPRGRDEILAERARLLRRLARHDEALETWQDLARGGGPLAVTAWIEVAKSLEHRRRDPAGALAATRSAQALVERARSLGRASPRVEAQLHVRARRLRRRTATSADAGEAGRSLAPSTERTTSRVLREPASSVA